MRKQYNFWSGPEGLDAWDVDRLVELSADLPVVQVPLETLTEVDTEYWYRYGDDRPTVRSVVEHLRLVRDADLSYPIILAAEGRVMDGMHRVARALVEDLGTISAVRFTVTPAPDHRNCAPEELPY